MELHLLGASRDAPRKHKTLFPSTYIGKGTSGDCCGTRCCVRALSIQRLWYFWVLLMMGVLFCCGAGFFVRRRMYPSPLRDEQAFNVSFTRHPATSPGTAGFRQIHKGHGVAVCLSHLPGCAHMMMGPYPPPPSYCNHPPPSYEQIFQNSDKK
uniref:WW domain binding protein VOPP1 n=1 Tax=Cyclopterus lumpus TaxID=8103 RepID=A0A8C3AA73_CYCLU